MRTLLILLLLIACSNKVVNPQEAYVMITQNARIVKDKETLHSREDFFTFSFITEKSEGLTPAIYIVGPIKVTVDDLLQEYQIKHNQTYIMHYRFSKPGRATILFIWESKNHFGVPFTLNLAYEASNNR